MDVSDAQFVIETLDDNTTREELIEALKAMNSYIIALDSLD